MSWKDWFAHLKAVPGFKAGAIYTFDGACCHVEGIKSFDAKSLATSFSSGAALTIDGVKFMVLQRTDEMLQARKDGVPVCVYKTNSMYLIVVGAKDASPGPLSSYLGKTADVFKSSGI